MYLYTGLAWHRTQIKELAKHKLPGCRSAIVILQNEGLTKYWVNNINYKDNNLNDYGYTSRLNAYDIFFAI